MIDDCTSPIAIYGTSFPAITSSGSTGVASRFSIVPRSRSRVIARPVIITIVSVRIVPIRPGTTLYCVMPSGLYNLWICTSKAAGVPFRCASGPVMSLSATACAMPGSAASGACVAVGSVASASTSSAGRSPRNSRREKSTGIDTTNVTSPRASARRPASSSGRVSTI
ncbi:hypothetical protein LMG29542_04841 [Paraburkholderia humisilvae]|uniref:Uncharacterized protein n=1 Tax=Paraburkholderia humisilvae TaxID=627669 RepID=A0A6J5ECV1_9BURK|nr:hypothetical protein LMG29542_04841 [Paraburkholderia humisilvae]